MKHPKISVIVTSYNIENYISQCLLSIKEQSFEDFECIVVDDGSTDATRKHIKAAIKGDRRFHTLYKENGGVSTARNAGFDIAKGEYVIFLDGDDFFSPQLLTNLYETSVSYDADITACNFIQYFDRMQKFGEPKIDFTAFKANELVSYKTHPKQLFGTLTFMFWNKLIRTQFLRQTGIRNNESLHRAQDIDFFGSALIATEKIAFIDIPLVNYRTDMKASNVNRLYKYPNDVIIALGNVKDALNQSGLYNRLHEGFLIVAADHILANLYFTETYPVHKEIYKRAKKLLISLEAAKYERYIKSEKTKREIDMLLEGDYEDWLRQRITDLRDDTESKYISYLLGEYQRKYEDEYSRRSIMESSLSWKVTKPLRGIRKVVKRK